MTSPGEMGAAAPAGESRTIDALMSALEDLHHRQGRPSYRAIGRAIGCSHTTVSRVFHAHDRPSWDLVRLIVGHLDGDEAQFRQLWYEAATPASAAEAPRRGSTFQLTAWVIGACFIVTTIALGSGSLRSSVQIWISDASQIVWGVGAAVALLHRASREHGRLRVALVMLAAGIASWSVGHVVWTVQRDVLGVSDVPSPGPADIGYYLLPVFTAVALTAFDGFGAQTLRRWLPSCAVIAASMWTIVVIIVAVFDRGVVGLGLGGVIALGYTVTDVVIAWWASHVARNSLTGLWTLVAMAFTALTLSDTVFVLVSQTNSNAVPPGADLGFIAAPMLLLAAAVTAQSVQPTADSAPEQWRARSGNRLAAVTGVAVCAGALAYALAVETTSRAVTGSALVTAVLAIGVLTVEVRKA